MAKAMLPDVWKLSDQNSNLHLDGGEVLQLDDLRDVTQSAVQPTGGRLLTDGQRCKKNVCEESKKRKTPCVC